MEIAYIEKTFLMSSIYGEKSSNISIYRRNFEGYFFTYGIFRRYFVTKGHFENLFFCLQKTSLRFYKKNPFQQPPLMKTFRRSSTLGRHLVELLSYQLKKFGKSQLCYIYGIWYFESPLELFLNALRFKEDF